MQHVYKVTKPQLVKLSKAFAATGNKHTNIWIKTDEDTYVYATDGYVAVKIKLCSGPMFEEMKKETYAIPYNARHLIEQFAGFGGAELTLCRGVIRLESNDLAIFINVTVQ